MHAENESNNYLNYLYECENDASTLFKCKLCSRLMTKHQATKLKCQLGILNAHGEYTYLHVPDEKFDLTHFLQLLKDKLKTWQCVYWFVWALVKSFRCKKCGHWFRLVELNKCRLNDYTFCSIHDVKLSSSAPNTNANPVCYCIHCDHVLDSASVSVIYEKSPILTKAALNTPEQAWVMQKVNYEILIYLHLHYQCKLNALNFENFI